AKSCRRTTRRPVATPNSALKRTTITPGKSLRHRDNLDSSRISSQLRAKRKKHTPGGVCKKTCWDIAAQTSIDELEEPPEVLPLPDPPPRLSPRLGGSGKKLDVQKLVTVPEVPVQLHEVKPPVLTSPSRVLEEPDADWTSAKCVIGVLLRVNLVRLSRIHCL